MNILQKLILTGKEFGFDIFPLIIVTVLDWVPVPVSQGFYFFGSILSSESEIKDIIFSYLRSRPTHKGISGLLVMHEPEWFSISYRPRRKNWSQSL